MLHFSLLGTPSIQCNGKLLEGFVTRKAEALLYYLAVTARPHTRSALAALLWPDMAEANARKNLRDVVASLRKVAVDALLISQHSLAFVPQQPAWVDVVQLEKVLISPHRSGLTELREAIGLYHGEFLAGFHTLNAQPFEDWMRQQRKVYQLLVVNGLHELADRYLAAGEIDHGLTATRRVLLLEPWSEEAHRKQMLFLARSGQRSAALAQYQACVQVLADELKSAPSPETVALYIGIRDSMVEGAGWRGPNTLVEYTPEQASRALAATAATLATPCPHNLPRQLTPMIGRVHALHSIRNKLLDPAYPVITIVGEGGVGKSRLALAVAHTLVERGSNRVQVSLAGTGTPSIPFHDGVWFVALADLFPDENPVVQVAVAIANALDLVVGSGVTAPEQLVEYLSPKELLLIIDNFEQFVGGVGFLLELLRRVRGLKLLVTSRRRLHLQAEFVYRLDGLAVPQNVALNPTCTQPIVDYESIQLFTERAQRASHGFELTPANQGAVSSICQIVDGLPLGIELAAALTERMDVSSLAVALAENLMLLAADLVDLPPRHRSIKAVLDYSWHLLLPTEAEVLARCSVFRDDFTVEAAAAVAGATPAIMDTLVHHSLLVRSHSGRMQWHKLVHQYAAAHLAQTPSRQEMVAQQHCDYYLALLHTMQTEMIDRQLVARLLLDIANLRAAWSWAVDRDRQLLIASSLVGFIRFYEMTGRHQEGEKLLAQALQRWQPTALAQSEAGSPVAQLVVRLRLGQSLFWSSGRQVG